MHAQDYAVQYGGYKPHPSHGEESGDIGLQAFPHQNTGVTNQIH